MRLILFFCLHLLVDIRPSRGASLRHSEVRSSTGGALARLGRASQANQVLWTYWDDPSPPPFVQLCLRSLEHRANNGWELRVVNRQNVRNFIDKSDLPKQFDSLQPAFQADSVRLALLRRHGGAWMDATTIATHDLSDWIGSAFQSGSRFVGFYIEHYTAQGGPPLVASWALASAAPEDPFMVAWHNAYLQLWRSGRTNDDGMSEDPFFQGVDLSQVSILRRDYLHVEEVFLAVLQRDSAMRDAFEQSSQLWKAEDSAYVLQSSLGMTWMVNSKCAPLTTALTSIGPDVQGRLAETPLVKLRHEDRQWVMKMSEAELLGHPDSVLGSLLSHNAGRSNSTGGLNSAGLLCGDGDA